MKKELRKELIKNRTSMENVEVEKLSALINSYIMEWDKYKEAKAIMSYYSFRNEVLTDELINHSFDEGKTVVLPKSIKEGSKILPCIIKSLSELKKENYGIMEPPTDNLLDRDELDIVFVPGVGFDKRGFRIGYGAGYYDRFLNDYKGIKVGVCFELQMVEYAYNDEHDIAMDYIITEKGIIKTGDE
ncbi:5-formyltetrahydrofolate cyclo-ligase [Clostridium cylindrosporum]|uniref:5-formyltetrahydrofolate cyclo-ligase n=1 Tax=Clostridium cylindrosporum DSM 605 TaxID=1121307 RepID=A0A0J8DFZ9_CLOCY|nr:5-formyltetrahydrofolate cyclo-ligase [Clostridium cylindrosporum]KMT23093.1 5-formyltetrahydrofolate cyclo-ligase [Clostridium cylindrosporum DSM 605]